MRETCTLHPSAGDETAVVIIIRAAVLGNNDRTPAVTKITADETGDRERGLTLPSCGLHSVYRG